MSRMHDMYLLPLIQSSNLVNVVDIHVHARMFGIIMYIYVFLLPSSTFDNAGRVRDRCSETD